MNVLFAHMAAFWLEAKAIWLFLLYHPSGPDCNEQLESYWPCSDKAQFWPAMYVNDP